nr:MAG TPA: hypothetical protein [Caudoviricetes sp.]
MTATWRPTPTTPVAPARRERLPTTARAARQRWWKNHPTKME